MPVPPAADLPPYVVDGNLYDALDKVQLQNVVMHSYCVKADKAKLQAWLDRTFSAPSGGAVRYEVLGDKVFLAFAQIGKLFTLNHGKPPKGYTSEIDVTVWILARRLDDGLFALRWIPAYLFVDSGTALVSGREVWGFPKQLGRFNFTAQGTDHGGAISKTVDGWVVSPYSPESPARWAPMFEVRPLQPKPHGGFLASLEALAAKTPERLTDDFATAAVAISTAISGGALTMAFLKQFPDAARPHLACYQAVIEAEATVTKFRGAGLTDHEYEVRVTSFASQPYHDELGISQDWQPVGHGVWMDFDFQQALGAEAWRAGSS